MIIDDLFEVAAVGMTSVQSIGKIEYTAAPNQIKLFRRDEADKPCCVASIKRITGKGWHVVPTMAWAQFKMPHFGQVFGANTSIKGMKTHSNKIEDIMKSFGIRYDSIQQMG